MARESPGANRKSLRPTAQLLAQTLDLGHPDVYTLWRAPAAPIAPFKFKSPRRRDQLSACARLLATAAALFDQSPEPLLAWQTQLIRFHHVPAWDFHTPASLPPLQRQIQDPTPSDPITGPQRLSEPLPDAPYAPRPPPPGLL